MILEIIKAIGILAGIIFVFLLIGGLCFQADLKDIEKTDPQFRKHLKDKYNI